MTSRRPRLLIVSLVASLALLLAACGGSDDPVLSDSTQRPTTTTTEAAAPPETVPDYLSFVATPLVDGELGIFAQPGAAQPDQFLPHPRLINNDPNAQVPLVLLAKQEQGDWIEVYLPVRPNGSTGWVRAADVGLTSHAYHIEVHLSDFVLQVFEADEMIMEAPIAVASENTPTPGGLYYTTELIRPLDAPDGPYGSFAYGLSGFSEVLTSFNGGPGQLGIHGTNQPELIGQAVSAGCIRLTNEDINRLVEEIQLPLGVPVEIFV